MKDQAIIFCDGASKGNPGPGGWAAVVIQNNSSALKGWVKEIGGEGKNVTNNQMELTAATEALENLRQGATLPQGQIDIYTDSRYLINGITKWIFAWQKNNWQTKAKEEVLNKDLWGKLVELVRALSAKGYGEPKWHYVGGHIGIAGNERCDEIASDLAQGNTVSLYDGPLSKYKIDILNFDHDAIKKELKKVSSTKSNSKTPAYSYVSLIKGVIYRDKTWAECEKRVKGTKGAKYQKAVSLEHENEIIAAWGK